jgi:hypothetical protein
MATTTLITVCKRSWRRKRTSKGSGLRCRISSALEAITAAAGARIRAPLQTRRIRGGHSGGDAARLVG